VFQALWAAAARLAARILTAAPTPQTMRKKPKRQKGATRMPVLTGERSTCIVVVVGVWRMVDGWRRMDGSRGGWTRKEWPEDEAFFLIQDNGHPDCRPGCVGLLRLRGSVRMTLHTGGPLICYSAFV
jgi:hypothetical protein